MNGVPLAFGYSGLVQKNMKPEQGAYAGKSIYKTGQKAGWFMKIRKQQLFTDKRKGIFDKTARSLWPYVTEKGKGERMNE